MRLKGRLKDGRRRQKQCNASSSSGGVELPDGALDDICKDFTKDTGINIKAPSNPYADTKTQIAAGAAAGTMADVVGLDGSWVYDFAKQGSIANLTELMEKDGYDDSQLSDRIKYREIHI